MLSVCIPVYNYDVSELVDNLVKQSRKCSKAIEIVVVDDASKTEYININNRIEKHNNVTFIKLAKNIGRSSIRNLLASKVKYNYILFLDCDSNLKPDFLETYLKAIDNNTQVICGGTLHPKECPAPSRTLRWKSGKFREDHSVDTRRKSQYKSFTSNNFIVQKNVLNKVSFNEKIRKYGHEDTLFGIELEQKKIKIEHIDNPAVHIGIDLSEDYIKKTEHAIENLVQLLKESEYRMALSKRITLLKYFNWISKTRMNVFVKFIFKLFRPLIIKNLLSTKPNLKLFDFYKIGYLVSVY
ncbi:glycosyltransferase family 2 protein [Saccharicrinis sp. 156]|uniref:glycosyltransferase family 2 protein n=1 Tax=Saccharicrinis sp. 156 TaxID=3417574 RepID=UPI003D3576AB